MSRLLARVPPNKHHFYFYHLTCAFAAYAIRDSLAWIATACD
jgi:hypothetical protein